MLATEESQEIFSTRAVDLTDHGLLERLSQGDQDAASVLYRRYAHRLRVFARANCSRPLAHCLDADDVVQSVFFIFFRGLRQRGYSIGVGDNLWALLRAIGLNVIRARANYHRAAKRDVRRTTYDVPLEVVEAPPHRSTHLPGHMLFLDVTRRVDQLPANQQPVVHEWLAGYSVPEIVARTHHPQRTVERWIGQFRKQVAATFRDAE
jgi:RNA polymerase sigma-70 factor (ECF subfamily)